MKLISMTAFVLQQQMSDKNILNRFMQISNYANFLKQPLELWMFVPCDEDRKVITESYNNEQHIIIQHLDYAEAKEKCLFEGFTIRPQGQEIMVITLDNRNVWINWNNSKTIEDLIYLTPQLTQTAIKQLGL